MNEAWDCHYAMKVWNIILFSNSWWGLTYNRMCNIHNIKMLNKLQMVYNHKYYVTGVEIKNYVQVCRRGVSF